MSIPVEDYKKAAKSLKHSKAFVKDVTNYAKKLKEKNLPILYSITHLAECLHMRPSEILKIAEYGNFFDIKRKSVKYENKVNWFLKIKKFFTSLKYRVFPKTNQFSNKEEIGLDDILFAESNIIDNDEYYYQDINEYHIINSNYKFFLLRKKRGGTREIMAPKGKLKNIQKWINHYILKKVELHSNCTGFRSGYSIKHNAKIHENQECILNIDLLKFFDTITQKRVFGMFADLGYHPNLARTLAGLTTAKHKEWYWDKIDLTKYPELKKLASSKPKVIPQGAPTSPAISNIICRKLDNRLFKLSIKQKCQYSRYADDITFSGKRSNLPSLKLVSKIIQEEGFYVNNDKVGIYEKGSKQYVTGLAINESVSVPRAKKRQIRQILHYCKIHGVRSHKKHTRISSKMYFKEWLAGNIAFIQDIEPRKAKLMWEQFNDLDWED